MRLFWAVTVPADITRAIDAAVVPLRARWPELRWTAPDGWHLTLAFLGDVVPGHVEALAAAVAGAVADIEPPDVRLAATADTPGRRAGVVWIPTVEDAALQALAEAVRDAGDAVAPADRRHGFAGHLTLARIPPDRRGSSRLAADIAAAYEGWPHRWSADHVALLASHPSPSGVVYRSQQTIALEGGG